MIYVKPIACTLKQRVHEAGVQSWSQTEQEEAGLDPVVPSGSPSPDTVTCCSWREVNSFPFSTRAD